MQHSGPGRMSERMGLKGICAEQAKEKLPGYLIEMRANDTDIQRRDQRLILIYSTTMAGRPISSAAWVTSV